MKRPRQQAERRGRLAEFIAAAYFRLRGYRIVGRRQRTLAGEIDLIVKNSRALAFVEVKIRGDLETAAYSISDYQRQRIARAAAAWLANNPAPCHMDIRFDAVLLAFPFHFRHMENAWRIDDVRPIRRR